MATPDPSSRTTAVLHDVAAAVRPLHLAVEDVTVTPAGKRRLVRVLLDRDLADLTEGDVASPVEPLSLDAIADATRVISDALDASDVMGAAPYVLEVSSPGTDRALTEPRHFRRNVGRLLEATVATSGDAAPEMVTGRVVAADEESVTVRPEDGDDRKIALADIERARVQVEFNRAEAQEEES